MNNNKQTFIKHFIKTIFDQLFSYTHCQNSSIVQNFKVLNRCKQSALYSLEPILVEEERPKLNTQITLNNKAKLFTVY